jgi:hypothetical protein
MLDAEIPHLTAELAIFHFCLKQEFYWTKYNNFGKLRAMKVVSFSLKGM